MTDVLDKLLSKSKEFQAASRAPGTWKGYGQDFDTFKRWCEVFERDPLPASVETVVLYFTAKVQAGWKTATMLRARCGICKAHDLAGHVSPTRSAAVRELIAGIKRVKGNEPKRKTPVSSDDLRRMVAVMPSRGGLRAKRDKAILLLGFGGALRRSEMCNLQVDGITWGDKGIILHLRGTKGDKEGAGQRVGVPRGRSQDVCPVTALRDWLTASGITTGPVFRPIIFDDRIEDGALAPQMVATVVKKCAKAIGLDPKTFGGHSLRRGVATEAAHKGATLVRLKQHLRHKSVNATIPYIEDAEAFVDNRAADLL